MDKNQTAVSVFNKRARTYQVKYMDLDLYNGTYDLFCEHLPKPDANVLELACGPGNITRYLLQKRPELKILGTDLAPNMIELAARNNPAAEFQLMDCRDIDKLNQQYDGVVCGFVLPYLNKEETLQLIRNAATILNAHGLLYVSTMEDDYEKSGLVKNSLGDEVFMHYYPADFLLTALKDNGFVLVDMQQINFPKDDGSVTTDLVILAKKQ